MTQGVQIDPYASACGLCEGQKIPILGTYCRICPKCDGWPPKLEPPAVPPKESR